MHCHVPVALPWQLDKKDVVASPWDLQPLFFIFLFTLPLSTLYMLLHWFSCIVQCAAN